MKKTLITLLLSLYCLPGFTAVILQYHHVSTSTPKSTSISPKQFEVHLQYLKDNMFTVIPLSELINNIKNVKPLGDKTVAITFDDGYQDNMTFAKPILDKFGYPYTIFINPSIINRNSASYLSWKQLKLLADEGVIIANHGYTHDSTARKPETETEEQWIKSYTDKLVEAEAIIKEKTGQNWQYFGYPYGEYTPAVQQWMKDNNYVAFSQQSGAVGLKTDLTSVPRFPASQPYDTITGLRDKLRSLPFEITLRGDNNRNIFDFKESKSITFNINVKDFYKSQLNCFISGLGLQKTVWNKVIGSNTEGVNPDSTDNASNEDSFTITYSSDLPPGRLRVNCTAASISKGGRYYWYSKPWFVMKKNGQWYPL
jgi:peptidoglycan/xylan/chitin deacetylase (PgdA/CDA1 family)